MHPPSTWVWEISRGRGLRMAAAVRSASFKFYYDVVCPFAYVASTVVEKVAERCEATVNWTPVLLGGLYEASQAPQGKDGSAYDVMSPAKLKISGQDMHRQMFRRGVTYQQPLNHPEKTVTAMRLLCAISDHTTRVGVSHNLYRAYWQQQRDVTDMNTLQEAVEPFGLTASKLLEDPVASRILRSNTAEAAGRGAFGVPGFYVGEDFYWGVDRLFFVERALGFDSHPERMVSPPEHGIATLTFFFDFSSPWSFLAVERLKGVIASVAPVSVKLECVPILLGALFKELGTPMVPIAAMNPMKRDYFRKDMRDWCSYAGVKLQWPASFPIRTVLPLRVALAADCDFDIITHMFRAAWQENQNIGDPKVLERVLQECTNASRTLLMEADSNTVKEKLFANTQRALDEGLCGVPSFKVNNSEVVWGQDKLNVVADMLCGWRSPFTPPANL